MTKIAKSSFYNAHTKSGLRRSGVDRPKRPIIWRRNDAMEWTKYVLALTVGGCLLILFGRNEDGRDKWLLGGGAGICLAAMELTVEYMWGDETWKDRKSVV